MKLKIKANIIILFVLALTSCMVTAPKTKKLYLNQTLNDFKAYHNAELVGFNVKKMLTINGNYTVSSSMINKALLNGNGAVVNSTIYENLMANGDTSLTKIISKGDNYFSGSLFATQTAFDKAVNFDGLSLILDYSTAPTVIIKDNNYATVKLINGTIIKGDVVFKSGHGKLIMDETSKVEGHIMGNKPRMKAIEIVVGEK